MTNNPRASKPVYRRSTTSARTYQGARTSSAFSPLKVIVPLLIVAAIIFFAVQALGSGDASTQADVDREAANATTATGFDSGIAESSPERTVTLSFAGDCTLGTDEGFDTDHNFNAMYDAVGDPSYFLANVKPIFEEDDITIVNMEGTLTKSTSRVDKTFAFKGPLEYAEILPLGDVEVAGFANNHDSDYGSQSHTDTIKALEDAGIMVASESRIAYYTAKNVKVGVIAMYELAEHRDIEPELQQYVATAREEGADVVVVYFHWGMEREYTPDENQIYLAHSAIDAGADMVVGSHPHVIQGYENYNGRWIVYSLGNFCYGGHSGPADKDTMIVQKTFTLNEDGVVADDQIEVIPCSISSTSSRNNYQPTPAEGAELTRIEAKLEELNANVQAALASYQG